MSRRHKVLSVFLIFALLEVSWADPDLPNPDSVIETIPSCSLIIPMDTANQPDPTTGFNLKAYGLAVHLLWNNIPLKWIIRTGKAYEGIDITASVFKDMNANPSTATAESVNFRAGPIVIPVTFARFAIPLINEYNSRGTTATPVKVWKVASSVQAPVRYTLKKKPFVAVLNSSTNYDIQTNFLERAGMRNGTHFRVMTKEEANSLTADVCVSLCTEPHFEGPFADNAPASSFVAAMHSFVNSGGNFLAECGGIHTYESCLTDYTTSRNGGSSYPTCAPGFFLTQKDPSSPGSGLGGLDTSKKSRPANPNIIVHHPDLAFFQFDGAFDQYIGGSVASIDLWREPGYRTMLKPTSYWGVQWADPSGGYNFTYYSAGGKIIPGQVGHNVWYITGHDVAGFIPAERQYLNAVLIPAERDASCGFDVDECIWGGCSGYLKRQADATPCSCTETCDQNGLCGGIVSDVCPRAPPPTAAPPPRTRLPPGSRTPSVAAAPGTGAPGTENGEPSTDPNATPANAPLFTSIPPSTAGPVPFIDVNSTQQVEVVQSEDGETRYFVLVVSQDVFTIQLFVDVLNWDETVTLEVFLSRAKLPNGTDSDCIFTNIRNLNWDYRMEAAGATSACKGNVPSLRGDWIVAVRTPKSTGYAFEAFLEPAYGRIVEETVVIGGVPRVAASLLAVVFAALLFLII